MQSEMQANNTTTTATQKKVEQSTHTHTQTTMAPKGLTDERDLKGVFSSKADALFAFEKSEAEPVSEI